MDNQELQAVTEIINMLNGSGAAALAAYTHWFIWSSVTWIVVGLIMSIAAYKKKIVEDHRNHDELTVFKWVVFAIGVLFVSMNVPDLIAPQGIAMHQIIKDITG